METTGINEIEDVLRFILTSFKAYQSANEDGEVTLRDYHKFIPVLMGIGDALTGIDQVPFQFEDLDDQEQEKLMKVAKEFYADMGNEELKGLINDSVRLVLDGLQLSVRWKNFNKAA